MISDAQSKRYAGWSAVPASPRLSPLEKGMLIWAVLDQKDKVLDVTCKQGAVLENIQLKYDCEVCGTADSMEQVKNARLRLKNADIVYGMAEDVPWRDDAFDVVLFDLSERGLEKSAKCFSEIMRVLKPDGQLVLGTQRTPRLIKKFAAILSDDEATNIAPTAQELDEAIRSAGFHQAAWHSVNLTSGIVTCWKPIQAFE